MAREELAGQAGVGRVVFREHGGPLGRELAPTGRPVVPDQGLAQTRHGGGRLSNPW